MAAARHAEPDRAKPRHAVDRPATIRPRSGILGQVFHASARGDSRTPPHSAVLRCIRTPRSEYAARDRPEAGVLSTVGRTRAPSRDDPRFPEMTRDDPRCRPDPRALSRLCAERRELLSCAAKGLQLELLNRQAAVLLSHRQPGVGIRSRNSVVVVLLIGAHLASPAERRLRRGACALLLARASLIARLTLHSRS